MYILHGRNRQITQRKEPETGNPIGQYGYLLKKLQTSACLAAFTLVFASLSSASPILDQAQLATTQVGQGFHSIRSIGQTFTAGVSGTLDSIELSLLEFGSGSDFTIEILDNSGGNLTLAPVLGSLSLPESAVGPAPINLVASSITGTLIDLSSLGIDIDSGDALAMRLSSARVLSNGDFYAANTSNTDPYALGSFFVDNVVDGNHDVAFKTFVVIPEPGSLTLLCLGALALLRLPRERL